MVSSIDESAFHERPVSAQVRCLAQAKGAGRRRRCRRRWARARLRLLTWRSTASDTASHLTVDRAVARWRQVRGKLGKLHTGHALVHVCAGRVVGRATDVGVTTVEFADLTDQEIADYVATGEPLNVARWIHDRRPGAAGTSRRSKATITTSSGSRSPRSSAAGRAGFRRRRLAAAGRGAVT